MNPPAHKLTSSLGPLRAQWQRASPREKSMVRLAAAVIALALLWWVGIAPALGTLKRANEAQRTLDGQEQHMLRLKSEADALKAAPRLPRAQALAALEASVKERLGQGGTVQVLGDDATVTLNNVSADTLAAWLADARVNARAVPTQLQLTPGADAGGGSARWSGRIALRLPPEG